VNRNECSGVHGRLGGEGAARVGRGTDAGWQPARQGIRQQEYYHLIGDGGKSPNDALEGATAGPAKMGYSDRRRSSTDEARPAPLVQGGRPRGRFLQAAGEVPYDFPGIPLTQDRQSPLRASPDRPRNRLRRTAGRDDRPISGVDPYPGKSTGSGWYLRAIERILTGGAPSLVTRIASTG
jgi:hypothetical protein